MHMAALLPPLPIWWPTSLLDSAVLVLTVQWGLSVVIVGAAIVLVLTGGIPISPLVAVPVLVSLAHSAAIIILRSLRRREQKRLADG